MSNNTTSFNYTDAAADIQAIKVDEAACYALPFGGIGFASHMLTYYMAALLVLGRQPLRPWKRLSHRRSDIVLGSVQLVITVVLTSISIRRCWRSWPFATLGVWMLTTSVCISVLPMIMSFVHNQGLEVERCNKAYGDKAGVTARASAKFVSGTIIYVILAVTVLALPWMYWALGMITGNLAGISSGDAKALYFGYVVAKRLGLLSLWK
ncbi:hypothetical protein PG994_005501 [Apiospora phragmitis]|uniref:Uncharacterized protein n=1 Tax=Apiospora phragmitis TaxID=2905665 RepID=A0ABR1VF72_9PEZI